MSDCKFCHNPIGEWKKEGGKNVPYNPDGSPHKCKDGVMIKTAVPVNKTPVEVGLLVSYNETLATFLTQDGKQHHYALTRDVFQDWQKAGHNLPPENHPDVWLAFQLTAAKFVQKGATATQRPEWVDKIRKDPPKEEVEKPISTGREILQQNLDQKRASQRTPTDAPGASAPPNTPTEPGKPAGTAPAPAQNPPGTPTKAPDEIELFKTLLMNISREGMPDLLKWLEDETDFYIAPSSTHFHDAVAGGLLHHSLKVLDYLIRLSDLFTVEIPVDSRIIIALLHDICKVNFYQMERKPLPRRDEKTGDLVLDDWGKKIWDEQMVYTVKDQLPLGHGEKSVILLQRFIKLTDLEIFAIRWHMMAYDDLHYSYAGNYAITEASDKYRVIPLVHMADLAASFLELKPETTHNLKVENEANR